MSAARATSTADSFRTPRACLSTLPNDGAIATPVRGKRTVVNVVTTVDNPPERGSLQRQTCREAPFSRFPGWHFRLRRRNGPCAKSLVCGGVDGRNKRRQHPRWHYR